MSESQSKVDMEAMNAAIDKVLAYTPPPKAKQDKVRAQRNDRQASSVQEPKGSYKTTKP